MFRKICILLVSAFALVAFSFATSARAETDAAVSGEIHTVDLAKREVTLKKSDGAFVLLKVNAETVIQRNGKNARLAALALRDTLTAKYSAGNGKAKQLSATGPRVKRARGTLEDALKSSGALVIGGKTILTTAQTKIARNGQVVSLSMLTRQDQLLAHLKPGAAPGAATEALDLIGDGPVADQIHGTIESVAGAQVTITPENGTAGIMLTVNDATMIEVNGAHALLADLQPGMNAEATYEPTTFVAFSIEAAHPIIHPHDEIAGTIAAVDVAAATVTITPHEQGTPVTLHLDAATEIQVNGAHATIHELAVGLAVRALYDKETLLAKRIQAGEDHHPDAAHIEGAVTAVDVTNAEVTIAPSEGDAVTLHVTHETEIEVNGAHATIHEIQVGMTVSAAYESATHNAIAIHAHDQDHGAHQIEGSVSAVDVTAATVTLTPQEGDAVTLHVTHETKIEVNGEHATIHALVVGMMR